MQGLKKYCCVLGEQEIQVLADSELAAQEQAFARTVRDLKPQDFFVFTAGDATEPPQVWPNFFDEG